MTFLPAIPKQHLKPAANPLTRRSHRREMFWQILLPLAAVSLGAAFLFYFLLAGGIGNIERGAQIAVILLALPTLVLGVVLLGLLLVLNIGIGKLIGWLPEKAAAAQRVAEAMNAGTQRSAGAVTGIVKKLDSLIDRVGSLFRRNF